MQNVKYDYSSCLVDVPSPLANSIIKWGQLEVPDDDLYVTQRDPTFGREDEIHITILYGIHSESSDKIKPILAEFGPIKIELGTVDVFTNPEKFDVVVIDVYSEDLKNINKELKEQIKNTNRYPIYKPHITIAYVKKRKGWKHRGIKKWEGKKFTCGHVNFSSKNGGKERIVL